MKEILITVGYPGGGKTTAAGKYFKTHVRLNRDIEGGSLADLNALLRRKIDDGETKFILDNTYGTKSLRAPIIKIGEDAGIPVKCLWLKTSIEDAEVNISKRMIEKFGKILSPSEIKNKNIEDPNTFPPVVIFSFRKRFEKPTMDEGFEEIERIKFVREYGPEYKNKALILDYDGTLRLTKSGEKYPRSPSDIRALPNRREILADYKDRGYRLLGVSNQSGISKGLLSYQDAVDCFEQTNKLIDTDIEYTFCPHRPNPISCYCRKPMPGLPVYFMEKYKLDPKETLFVGDMTTDRTCATRAGINFEYASTFFEG